MWIEDLPNGKYKFIERYEEPLTGKTRRVSVTHTKKTKAVQEEMLVLLHEKIKKRLNTVEVMKISFKELSDKWFNVYKQTVKASTSYNVNTRLSVILQALGEIILNKLTPAVINKFLLDSLEIEKRAYRTVAGDKSIILRILKFGSKYGYCDYAKYYATVDIPKINMSKKDDLKYLERHELQSFYDQLDDLGRYETKRLCMVQVATGMRYNELVALDYEEDIDLSKRLIHISKNYDPNNDVFTTPKTSDVRTIDIDDNTALVIRQQIEFTKLKMIKYNLERDNTLLFKGQTGRPLGIRAVNRILKQVDIPDKTISTHIFRHTFITYMVEAGQDINLIAKHVGHSSNKMINQVYAHFTETMRDDLKDMINNVKII